jgi:hypothetical protein
VLPGNAALAVITKQVVQDEPADRWLSGFEHRLLAVGTLLRGLWGRYANLDCPSESNGPTITPGWYTLVRVWDGQQVRQYVDGLRTNTVAVTAAGLSTSGVVALRQPGSR